MKIKDKELENGKLYNKKAIIISIHQEYVAKIKLIDHDLIFLIDQKFLETVIPVFFLKLNYLFIIFFKIRKLGGKL